ncbi:uncharacterized protein LOC101862692 [Aplysia californica]|uniref:Uncharacterized protein LOC101862692 n=1 Tax=Aplysia californica TaxID=6500 RepID=A0ABM1ACC2_APLCA|nr:uncharacterized protein LOC101862692 [Aplysia californica]
MECRYVQMCDVSSSCRSALPTCVYKDPKFQVSNPCPRGHPVLSLRGDDFLCTGDKDCPMGFECGAGVCCLPELQNEPTGCSSLGKSQGSHGHIELCMDECLVHDHCLNHELCCSRGCSRKCIATNDTALVQLPSIPNSVGGATDNETPPSPNQYIRTGPTPFNIADASAPDDDFEIPPLEPSGGGAYTDDVTGIKISESVADTLELSVYIIIK